MRQSIEIPTADNLSLPALFFEPQSPPKSTIVLSPGTGIPKEFYEGYGNFLASEGHIVLVFDYRGVGKYLEDKQLYSAKVNLQNWGSKDMVAAVNWMKRKYPNQKLYFFGHSIGGQLAGLMENHHLIDRYIFFSSTTGHWSVFGFPFSMMVIFMFYLQIPIASRLFGYLPKNLTYRGVAIAKGVALEWAKWSRNKGYIAAFLGKTIPQNYYQEITQKIDVIWFKDDPIATNKAIFSMLDYYFNANITHHPMTPEKLELPRMGHSGFFKKGGKKIWGYPLEILKN